MSYVAQKSNPSRPPEPGVRGVSPVWAAWALFCGGSTGYCCPALVGGAGPQAASQWLLRNAGGQGRRLAGWGSAEVLECAGLSAGHARWCEPVDNSKTAPASPCLMKVAWVCKNGSCRWVSPPSVPAGSCLSGRCFEISKWIPFTYGPGTFFNLLVWARFCGEWVCTSTLSGFSTPCSSIIFLGCIPCTFSKAGVWGTCLSCAGSRGWSAW